VFVRGGVGSVPISQADAATYALWMTELNAANIVFDAAAAKLLTEFGSQMCRCR
jgi:hypothetical protein